MLAIYHPSLTVGQDSGFSPPPLCWCRALLPLPTPPLSHPKAPTWDPRTLPERDIQRAWGMVQRVQEAESQPCHRPGAAYKAIPEGARDSQGKGRHSLRALVGLLGSICWEVSGSLGLSQSQQHGRGPLCINGHQHRVQPGLGKEGSEAHGDSEREVHVT